MTHEIKGIPFGKVEAGTPEYEALTSFARAYMQHYGISGPQKRGLFRGFWRGIKLSYLVDRLEPYGWAIRMDGEMYPVPVAEVGAKVAPAATQPAKTDADVVREGIANTGYVIDPQTGRKLPPHERRRWGV